MHRNLSLLTPSGRLTLGNLLGALRPMAAGAARRRLLLRHRRPARADRPARPGAAARPGPRDGDAAARRRPRRLDALRPEPGAGARPARLPARVHRAHRRAEPDDPVQGEGPRRRLDPGLALHLPGADGGRHPALPPAAGAGRRRPAPARRAHPRPRDPLQQHLRAGLHRPRDHRAAGRRAGHATSPTRPEDGQVGLVGAPASSRLLDPPDVVRRKIARAVTDSDTGAGRRPGRPRQARRDEPAGDPRRLRRLCRRHHDVRRPEAQPSPTRSSPSSSRSRRGTPSWPPTRRTSTGSIAPGPSAAARSPRRCWPRPRRRWDCLEHVQNSG